jgi:hypothetical protein
LKSQDRDLKERNRQIKSKNKLVILAHSVFVPDRTPSPTHCAQVMSDITNVSRTAAASMEEVHQLQCDAQKELAEVMQEEAEHEAERPPPLSPSQDGPTMVLLCLYCFCPFTC